MIDKKLTVEDYPDSNEHLILCNSYREAKVNNKINFEIIKNVTVSSEYHT